jgi:hypothetical protein
MQKLDLNKGTYMCFKQAIELREWISERIVEEHFMISFFGTHIDVYELMITLCLDMSTSKNEKNRLNNKGFDSAKNKQEKTEDAVEYLERSKSNAFIKILSSRQMASNILEKKNPLLLERERTLRRILTDLQIRYIKNGSIINVITITTKEANSKIFETNLPSKSASLTIDPAGL